MQQLQFEASWDKALSAQDRNAIEKLFNDTKEQQHTALMFSPIREALNHRNELLVTVLVHNFSDNPVVFDDTRLVYSNEQVVVAENIFTLPTLTIPPHVSMPWTFIFTVHQGIALGNGRLTADFNYKASKSKNNASKPKTSQ